MTSTTPYPSSSYTTLPIATSHVPTTAPIPSAPTQPPIPTQLPTYMYPTPPSIPAQVPTYLPIHGQLPLYLKAYNPRYYPYGKRKSFRSQSVIAVIIFSCICMLHVSRIPRFLHLHLHFLQVPPPRTTTSCFFVVVLDIHRCRSKPVMLSCVFNHIASIPGCRTIKNGLVVAACVLTCTRTITVNL